MAIIGYVTFIPENKNTKNGDDEYVLSASTFGIKVNSDGSKGVVQTSATRTVATLAMGFAEALGTLLADPARSRRMGAAGREWVLEHGSLRRMAADYARLYEP